MSGSEETEVVGAWALATGPDATFFRVSWEGGAGPSCNSATATARFVGHRESFTWGGEYASKARQSSTSWECGSKVK